jgi:hypothetical protein
MNSWVDLQEADSWLVRQYLVQISGWSPSQTCTLCSSRQPRHCLILQDEEEAELAPEVPTLPPGAVADKGKAAAPAAGAPGPTANGKGGKGRKRTGEEIIERAKERAKRAKEHAATKDNFVQMKVNTSVYVTGLPDDVTEEEVSQVGATVKGPCLLPATQDQQSMMYLHTTVGQVPWDVLVNWTEVYIHIRATFEYQAV